MADLFPAFDNGYSCLLGFAPLFALNTDIQEVHNQLERYYSVVSERAKQVAHEIETVFRQKIELGLFDQPRDRIQAMKTLRVTRDPSKFQ